MFCISVTSMHPPKVIKDFQPRLRIVSQNNKSNSCFFGLTLLLRK